MLTRSHAQGSAFISGVHLFLDTPELARKCDVASAAANASDPNKMMADFIFDDRHLLFYLF